MAFKVEEINETNQSVEVGERLWLTADQQTVVADGDPAAAFLFAAPGTRVSRDDAERYGLVKTKTKPATKDAAPAENKAADVAENKDGEAKWPHTHDELDALGQSLGVVFGEDAKVAEKQEALEAAGHKPGEG